MNKHKTKVDDHGRVCTKCGKYKPWKDYSVAYGNTMKSRCRQCVNESLRGSRPGRQRAKKQSGFFVYKAYQDDLLLYVGYTTNLRSRLSDHKRDSVWWTSHNRMELIELETMDDMVNCERDLIENESPLFNIVYNVANQV